MFRSTSSAALTHSQTYASCVKYVGRGSSPSRSVDARLASPSTARQSPAARMPPPPPRSPATPTAPARPASSLFGAVPAFAAAASTRLAPAFGAGSGRGSHASDECGAEALFGAHAAHSPVATPAPAANAAAARGRAAPHVLSAQSGPCPTIALASGLKALKEDVAHLREQHHDAVEAAGKRHRELVQVVEHARDDKRARTTSEPSLAREVGELSARLSELASALAAQAAHVAALQAELRAERADAPAGGDFFDLFFDGDDGDDDERLDGAHDLAPLADDRADAASDGPPPAAAAGPCANGGLPPDEDDDDEGGAAGEPPREWASQSVLAELFAPIAPASPEAAGGASAPPALCRPAALARGPAPLLTPAAREPETSPPDAGAYRLRSASKGGRGSDSQSDSARRRLFDFDFARAGSGSVSVAEDLFDNAMSQ